MSSNPQVEQIAKRLFERRHDRVIPQLAEGHCGDWRPLPNQCHQNVTIWCQATPGHKAVRGWVLFDFGGLLPFVRFVPHSVVETEEGRLVDITPTSGTISAQYPFIRAEETEEQYAALITHNQISQIQFYVETGEVRVF